MPSPVSFRIHVCTETIKHAWGIEHHIKDLIEWINKSGNIYKDDIKELSRDYLHRIDPDDISPIYASAITNNENVLCLHKSFERVRDYFMYFIEEEGIIPQIKNLLGDYNDFYETKADYSHQLSDEKTNLSIRMKIQKKSEFLKKLAEELSNNKVIPGQYGNHKVRPRDLIGTLFIERIADEGWTSIGRVFNRQMPMLIHQHAFILSTLCTEIARQRTQTSSL